MQLATFYTDDIFTNLDNNDYELGVFYPGKSNNCSQYNIINSTTRGSKLPARRIINAQ